ncbi:hypothetical protein Tco_0008963 [Tanacetum coccineum]
MRSFHNISLGPLNPYYACFSHTCGKSKILRVLRIILVVLPEHLSDTKVLAMKMEILLEPTSNKLLVGKYGDFDGYTSDDLILILEILSRRFFLDDIYCSKDQAKMENGGTTSLYGVNSQPPMFTLFVSKVKTFMTTNGPTTTASAQLEKWYHDSRKCEARVRRSQHHMKATLHNKDD